jgi:hypothetical protein
MGNKRMWKKLAFVSALANLCGNEYTFYPPLTQMADAMPAVALRDEYQGRGLGDSWSYREKRSAFVGSFER